MVRNLRLAAWNGDAGKVKEILLAGEWEGSDDALRLAAAGGHCGVLAVLTEEGLFDGETLGGAVLAAAKSGEKDAASFLLGKGACVREGAGKDALAWAKEHPGDEIAALIISAAKKQKLWRLRRYSEFDSPEDLWWDGSETIAADERQACEFLGGMDGTDHSGHHMRPPNLDYFEVEEVPV